MELEFNTEISSEQKDFLMQLFGNIFNACFTHKIDDCKSFKDLKELMFEFSDEISDFVNEENKSQETIEDLEEDIEELKEELSEVKDGSLFGQIRYDVFIKYCKHMSPWELEAMFKNLKTAV